MTNQNNTPQSTIDPIYRNLARGETPDDKSTIICRNTAYIDAICDLIASFDTSTDDEPVVLAVSLIQHLSREITINHAGLYDHLKATKGGGHDT